MNRDQMLASLLGGGGRFYEAGGPQQQPMPIPVGPSPTRAGDRMWGAGGGAAGGVNQFGNSIGQGLEGAQKAKQGYDMYSKLASLFGGGGGTALTGDAALSAGGFLPSAGGATGTNIAGTAGPLTMDAVFPAGGAAGGAGGGAGGAASSGGWLAGLTGGGGLAGAAALGGFGAVAAGLPITLWYAYKDKGEMGDVEKDYRAQHGDAAWEEYKKQENTQNALALTANGKMSRGEQLTPEEQAAWDRLAYLFAPDERGD